MLFDGLYNDGIEQNQRDNWEDDVAQAGQPKHVDIKVPVG